MPPSQPQPRANGWRAQVTAWLRAVEQYQRLYLVDLRAAGNQHAAAFPKNLLLVIVSQVVRSLAVWFVKSAIRDAATELGISLSEEEGQLLASLAVDALAA